MPCCDVLQAGPLPEAPPLDTTSPLAGSATAPGGLNPFAFGPGNVPGSLEGLTSQQKQVCGATRMPTRSAQRARTER